MATISLCMIAQDEEEVLAENLVSAVDFVDEIIILDGGSVDKTRDIALSIPKVKVYEYPFDKHFGDQKNRCLAYATCDMILFKDADEQFENDILVNLQRLVDMLPWNQHDAFAFARKTYISSMLINLLEPDFQVRYWKNRKGIRYEGHLHEQVTGYDDMLSLAGLYIIHQKTPQMQAQDNELYWDMGQEPPAGWTKKSGKWVYEAQEDEEKLMYIWDTGQTPPPGWFKNTYGKWVRA